MKIFLMCICCLSSLFLKSAAQNIRSEFDIDNYQHTINYINHKATFYTQRSGKKLKSTDTDKKYYWYSNNQINATQGGFSGKLLSGLYSDFYVNKNLKEQEHFNMGLKEGIWKTWTEDGLLFNEMNYLSGLLQGEFFIYNKEGNVFQEGRYKKGKLHGMNKKQINQDSFQVSYYKRGIIVTKGKKGGKGWVEKVFSKKL